MSTLYVVSTPIGNLDDITKRALFILEKCDFILAEDTRQTKQLLTKYEISKKIVSFHEHSEFQKIPQIISLLKQGGTLALVSDAGTPTIADPGFKLVRECISENINVVPIPGPSSAVTALSASGLPTDQFLFLGFFPKKVSKQEEMLKFIELVQNAKPTTVIFFESPYRIRKTLGVLAEKFPEKDVVIARELTKKHEEFIRGKLEKITKTDITLKGEFTLLIR